MFQSLNLFKFFVFEQANICSTSKFLTGRNTKSSYENSTDSKMVLNRECSSLNIVFSFSLIFPLWHQFKKSQFEVTIYWNLFLRTSSLVSFFVLKVCKRCSKWNFTAACIIYICHPSVKCQCRKWRIEIYNIKSIVWCYFFQRFYGNARICMEG